MATNDLQDALMPLIRQAVAEAMAERKDSIAETTSALVDRYGETVSLDGAARKVLHRSETTIRDMIDHGLLAQTADGRIVVRSIARYLATPPEARPATARRRKYAGEYNV